MRSPLVWFAGSGATAGGEARFLAGPALLSRTVMSAGTPGASSAACLRLGALLGGFLFAGAQGSTGLCRGPGGAP